MEPYPHKPGPVPHGYVDIHIDLTREQRDWAKRQPEGVSALVRHLLCVFRSKVGSWPLCVMSWE